jgi:hypothetical protein
VTVPYCEPCDRFYNPNTLSPAGECPEGHQVADPEEDEPLPSVPWHFKLMLVALIAYLGWRLVQFIAMLF